MSVSVIIPIHNAAPFLHETLESVYDALVDGDELITVFDDCHDDSAAVYEAWRREKQAAPHVDVAFAAHHVGVRSISLSRNIGLDAATRDWVAFVDHDDLVASEMYKILTSAGDALRLDVVRCGYAKFFRTVDEVVFPDFSPEYYAFFGIFVWNGVLRRECINRHGIRFVPGYGEDYEFNLQLARVMKGQHFVQQCFYFWRMHQENHHKKRSPIDFMGRVESLIEHCGDYLLACPNAQTSFAQWLTEYTEYLNLSFPVQFVSASLSGFKRHAAFFRRLSAGLPPEISFRLACVMKANAIAI